MMNVREAYSKRASEYVAALGEMATVHPLDELLVSTWARSVEGPVLDAGSGPGHWTQHLAGQGVDVEGIDQVPEFVASARSSYPDVRYALGSVDALPHDNASVAGVLAWYSLIHHEPERIAVPLSEFARILRPGGALLVGFFEGAEVQRFDHAIVDAFRWPTGSFGAELSAAGFEVIETHTRTASTHRPHAAVVARRRPVR